MNPLKHWTAYIDPQTPICAVSKRFARFLILRWQKTQGRAISALWEAYTNEATK